MRFLELAKKNREFSPKSWEKLYESEIIRRIRAKYSVDQELAILRQRETKSSEFDEYNAFAEACKREVKTEMGKVD